MSHELEEKRQIKAKEKDVEKSSYEGPTMSI